MNKFKKILSAISKGVIVLIKKISTSKIVISKNRKLKMEQNIVENVSLVVNRNDDCEISGNYFVKK